VPNDVEIQRALNKKGYKLVEDGDIGPVTRAAVIDFQVNNGLVADGDPGIKTQTALGMFDTPFVTAKREKPINPADSIVRGLANARNKDVEFMGRVKEKIKFEEGFGKEGRPGLVYKDTKGLPTVGYGFNLADSGLKSMIDPEVVAGRRAMTEAEGEAILSKRLPSYINAAKEYAGPAWDKLSDDQRLVLIDMHYNMGNKARFPKMGEAIQAGDYERAAQELLNSDYAKKDVPKRAGRNAELLRKGKWSPNSNDLRPDGTKKGKGWMGVIPTKDGGVMTEKTIGVNFDGKETNIPLIVPTSTAEELTHLANGGKPTPEMIRKAQDFAIQRMRQGLSPYKD
jgi:GH24 family phage-related lysozyme (muramidase)